MLRFLSGLCLLPQNKVVPFWFWFNWSEKRGTLPRKQPGSETPEQSQSSVLGKVLTFAVNCGRNKLSPDHSEKFCCVKDSISPQIPTKKTLPSTSFPQLIIEDRWKEIMDAVTLLIAKDVVPFYTGGKPGFMHYIKYLHLHAEALKHIKNNFKLFLFLFFKG